MAQRRGFLSLLAATTLLLLSFTFAKADLYSVGLTIDGPLKGPAGNGADTWVFQTYNINTTTGAFTPIADDVSLAPGPKFRYGISAIDRANGIYYASLGVTPVIYSTNLKDKQAFPNITVDLQSIQWLGFDSTGRQLLIYGNDSTGGVLASYRNGILRDIWRPLWHAKVVSSGFYEPDNLVFNLASFGTGNGPSEINTVDVGTGKTLHSTNYSNQCQPLTFEGPLFYSASSQRVLTIGALRTDSAPIYYFVEIDPLNGHCAMNKLPLPPGFVLNWTFDPATQTLYFVGLNVQAFFYLNVYDTDRHVLGKPVDLGFLVIPQNLEVGPAY